jgi:CRP-like cAMP-binding protein
MKAATPAHVVNHLIEVLSPTAKARMLGRLEKVDLAFGDMLCEAEQPFKHVYFPLSGFISLVATVGLHPPLEMGLIGNEGMLGSTLVLGVPGAPLRGIVQGAGTAMRMTAQDLRGELKASPSLVRTLQRYQFVLSSQLAQTAGCTRFHEIEARLARWLLMTHDRAQGDHFHLTHQFLANMLGVQRSAVTIAAGTLQGQGLIRYTRGEIRILDRTGLEGRACECYAAVVRDYEQIFA